jgi:hypothetical protein
MFLANDFYFVSLDSKIRAKDSPGHSSAISAVAEMPSPMAGEEFRVVDFDSDGTTQTVSFHV